MPGRLPAFASFRRNDSSSADDSDSEISLARAISRATPFVDLPAIPPSPEEQLMHYLHSPTPSPSPAEEHYLMQPHMLASPLPAAQIAPVPQMLLPTVFPSTFPSPSPSPPSPAAQIAGGAPMPDSANIPQIPPAPPPPPIVIAPVDIEPSFVVQGVPRLQHITNHMHSYITPVAGRSGLFTVEVFVEYHFYVESVGMISLAARASRIIRAYHTAAPSPREN